ncbi:MAG TPA: hypothetical protein VGT44_19465, partial [Ktedonobacteraceae bacterium]|nr:hypothetical protein [Ktedonobacteraceae bacterium]
ECLVMDMVTTPTVPPDKRSEYGRTMISHLLRELQAWGEQGVEITKFHAVSSTPAGQHILASAKFVSGTKITAGRVTFELDVSNSDAIWLRGYKAALEQWKLRQKVPATSSPSAGKTRGASINP